jgi:hypothetical protein
MMDWLPYLTIATALLSLVANVHLVFHPEVIGWKRSTARTFGGITAVLCVLILVLTLMQSHGKA